MNTDQFRVAAAVWARNWWGCLVRAKQTEPGCRLAQRAPSAVGGGGGGGSAGSGGGGPRGCGSTSGGGPCHGFTLNFLARNSPAVAKHPFDSVADPKETRQRSMHMFERSRLARSAAPTGRARRPNSSAFRLRMSLSLRFATSIPVASSITPTALTCGKTVRRVPSLPEPREPRRKLPVTGNASTHKEREKTVC